MVRVKLSNIVVLSDCTLWLIGLDMIVFYVKGTYSRILGTCSRCAHLFDERPVVGNLSN